MQESISTDQIGSRHIVVEGPIGVGKTALARRLSQAFACSLNLERPEDNPFLERFYRAPRQFALPTQLFFLFQRARQLQELKQNDMFVPTRVSDFLLEKDALFAKITLDDDELRLYRQVYAQLAVDIPAPDLVIYLQASVDTLLGRIRNRGIDYERYIEPEYLQQLIDSYTSFFYTYNAAPLLIVNAEEINLVDNSTDFDTLFDQVRRIEGGRHFFNPLAASM